VADAVLPEAMPALKELIVVVQRVPIFV